eukprot:GHVP01049080.1.p1 GENE.GHVP01049080.1~~GHVP01049080.1.p1  ORF type:complete len:794 (-),score=118.88 GHVP01049080.1:494-2875(-)
MQPTPNKKADRPLFVAPGRLQSRTEKKEQKEKVVITELDESGNVVAQVGSYEMICNHLQPGISVPIKDLVGSVEDIRDAEMEKKNIGSFRSDSYEEESQRDKVNLLGLLQTGDETEKKTTNGKKGVDQAILYSMLKKATLSTSATVEQTPPKQIKKSPELDLINSGEIEHLIKEDVLSPSSRMSVALYWVNRHHKPIRSALKTLWSDVYRAADLRLATQETIEDSVRIFNSFIELTQSQINELPENCSSKPAKLLLTSLYIYLGDLYRYRELVQNEVPSPQSFNYKTAKKYYQIACRTSPLEGHAYSQLILTGVDGLSAAVYSIRAFIAPLRYGHQETVGITLQNPFLDPEFTEVTKDAIQKVMSVSSMIFSKVDLHKIESFLKRVKQTVAFAVSNSGGNVKLINTFFQLVLLPLFILHEAIGNIPDLKPKQKTGFNQRLENCPLYLSDCVKDVFLDRVQNDERSSCAFQLLRTVVEAISLQESKNYVLSLLPCYAFVSWLTSCCSISDVSEELSEVDTLLFQICLIAETARLNLSEHEAEFDISKSRLPEDEVFVGLFPQEWEPEWLNEDPDVASFDEFAVLRILRLVQLCKRLPQNEKAISAVNEKIKSHGDYSEVVTRVVIDGQNVGVRYGECASRGSSSKYKSGIRAFNAKGLEIVADYYEAQNYQVTVMLPDDDWIGRIEENKRILNKLTNEKKLIRTPKETYDDSFCVRYAKSNFGVVVTNDMYRDQLAILEEEIIDIDRKLDPIELENKKKDLESMERFIKSRLIHFTFIDDIFMPNPDFRFPGGV